jgi:2-hydroxy-6-oxonona-2,4-dienedioate hydrolase
MQYGLHSDFLYWLGLTVAPDAMIRSLLATDPALVHAATFQEQARVREILQLIQPVSLRADGFTNDAAQAGAPPLMPFERMNPRSGPCCPATWGKIPITFPDHREFERRAVLS